MMIVVVSCDIFCCMVLLPGSEVATLCIRVLLLSSIP